MLRETTKERMDEAADDLARRLINGELATDEKADVLTALSFHRDAEAHEREAIAAEREADNADRKREAYVGACGAVKQFFTELKPVLEQALAQLTGK